MCLSGVFFPLGAGADLQVCLAAPPFYMSSLRFPSPRSRVLFAVVTSGFDEVNTNAAKKLRPGAACITEGRGGEGRRSGGGGKKRVTKLIEEDGEGTEGEPEGLSGC